MKTDSRVNSKAELDRYFEMIATALPERGGRFVRWLRNPAVRWVRIPLSILLILGGIFSFLPVLGIWMLPLGLMLLAQDLPFLQGPIARFLGWSERKWLAWKASRAAERDQSEKQIGRSDNEHGSGHKN